MFQTAWEQLGLVVRYVVNGHAVERLVEYIKCASCMGERVTGEIVSKLSALDLDPQLCRTQTYDGAGNMAALKQVVQLCSRATMNVLHISTALVTN